MTSYADSNVLDHLATGRLFFKVHKWDRWDRHEPVNKFGEGITDWKASSTDFNCLHHPRIAELTSHEISIKFLQKNCHEINQQDTELDVVQANITVTEQQ